MPVKARHARKGQSAETKLLEWLQATAPDDELGALGKGSFVTFFRPDGSPASWPILFIRDQHDPPAIATAMDGTCRARIKDDALVIDQPLGTGPDPDCLIQPAIKTVWPA